MKKDVTIVDELSSILSNKRKTASVLGRIELAKIETVIAKLSTYHQERKDEEKAQREALENTQSAIEEVLSKTGLSWDEVSKLAETQVSKKPVRHKKKSSNAVNATSNDSQNEARYKDGECEWDGTGEQPKWIKERLEMGFELKEFEVPLSA
ncbi:DNA-binding protein H-NS [Vibrio mediterranei AK1]|uniref:H-NS family histone-like protein n=1 Tax=Vibrio mediterranei TaxID=689 RepID=UPI000154280F|nr:H-NS family nucleoid-associated regulatory protein [Vibrio mediterranei]EDL52174.1 DNA-binding protein H-NS [Vibrio mediterranei AK1]